MAAGYGEDHIEVILKIKKENTKTVDLSRPTCIKVDRKYLSPEHWMRINCRGSGMM